MTKRWPGLLRMIAAPSLAMLVSTACVTWAPVNEPLTEALERTQHIRVTTVDGVVFQIEGNESNPIRVEDGALVGPLGAGEVSLPLLDIAHVEMVEGSSRGKTTLFALSLVGIVALLAVLMSGVEVGDRP